MVSTRSARAVVGRDAMKGKGGKVAAPREAARKPSDDEDDGSSSSSAPSSSASSSSSSSSSASSSSSDEDDDLSEKEEDEPDLSSLLAAAIEASRKKQASADKGRENFEANEDVIRLEGGEQTVEDVNQKEKAETTARGSVSGKREAKVRVDSAASNRVGKTKEDPAMDAYFSRLERGEELGESKPKTGRAALRQRQAERAKTAGAGWFDMPAFPGSTSSSSSKGGQAKTQKEQLAALTKPNDSLDARSPTAEAMRREVQAIRLRNAMDPKRFYRGGSGDKGMPKFAQLGRVISSAAQPASTLGRQERGRTVVEELVKDAQASSYAKRKFQEQNVKRTPGQRSNFVKRKARDKGNNKRQRR